MQPPGAELLASGRYQEALVALRQIFALGDTAPASVLNLAIAESHTNNPSRGQDLTRSVAIRQPQWDEPVLRSAESLRACGHLSAAEVAYERVLDLNPWRLEALVALGGLLLMRGDAEQAHGLLSRACAAAPTNPEAWNTLGLALQRLNVPHLALAAFTNAQHLEPRNLEYVLNGANAADDKAAELARLLIACEHNPLNPASRVGYGILLERMGRRPEAIDSLEAATALCPDDITLLKLFGGVLARSSHVRQAEDVFRRINTLDANDPQSCNDHAAILMRLHRHVEARTLLLDVLERHGPHPSVLCNLANATVCAGLQDEAVNIAREAIKHDPDATLTRRALCNTLPYQDGTTGAAMFAAMRDCSAVLPRVVQPPLTNTTDPHRPLTVGLLSGTLRSHPVGWLTVAAIEALDPAQFNIICLAQNAAPEDPIARRYRTIAQEWLDVDGLTDLALTQLARFKGIDILIDLGGYGDAARMPACANRLAPVQIKWVGMQAHSSGLSEMDWFITDKWETPPGFDRFYSERLLRMPDGYVCYSPPLHAPDVAELPALTNGYVTFGCFNNLAKITPLTLATWADILRRVPTARLIVKTHQLSDPLAAETLLGHFDALGIAAERIGLQGSSGHRALMMEYNKIDIVLDPLPYSGGLTTCEALWMGVPTLTVPGEIFASRHSASHMSNVGLEDWVTDSIPAYIDAAVARVTDIPALAALRTGLREQVRQSPLCNALRFGQNLGSALRGTWQAWCAEQTAKSY